MAGSGSKKTVITAIVGNAAVMVAKFVGFFFTGSASLLSEGIHTSADLLNQILLLVGIVRSGKSADRNFEYGYGSEQYIWSLISAVGIFFLGCGVTVYHGIHSLLNPSVPGNLGWAMAILVISLIIEGYVLLIAVRTVKQKAEGKPFFDYLRKEAEPSLAAVVLEDSAACLGVLIALVAIGLTLITGQVFWDAIGTLMIGFLLGGIAIWLIYRNHALLVGPSVPIHIREQVLSILEKNPMVDEVVDLRTRVLDTDTYRIKADIKFEGSAIAKKLSGKLKGAYAQIKGFEDFEDFAKEYADDIVELLADEIDHIEKQIKKKIPKAKYMDLEAD